MPKPWESTIPSTKLEAQALRLGLDPKSVALHHERISSVLENDEVPTFKIQKNCTVNNGGIIEPVVTNPKPDKDFFVSFVPAAGASSRYFKPLTDLILAIDANDQSKISAQIDYLKAQGAETWPLPQELKELFADPNLVINRNLLKTISESLKLPKALQPCVQTGETFFEVKCREFETLKSCAADVYVVPPKFVDQFKEQPKRKFLVQGADLSTIRFTERGEPLEESDGNYSMVPAGHGTLTKLIAEVGQMFPKSKAVFIRNIDNVIGGKKEATSFSNQFLNFYQWVHQKIEIIRQNFDDLGLAREAASDLLDLCRNCEVTSEEQEFLAAKDDPLWEVQIKLFHSSREADLEALYARPLNILGQVPNLSKNVGGSPVFCESEVGPIKLCTEGPHATKSDQDEYLANATHFNPVYAAAETSFAPNHYHSSQLPLWILAKKSYRAKDVYYHESVLYELLGNSHLANLIFVTVPPAVFTPHKSLADGSGRKITDWF